MPRGCAVLAEAFQSIGSRSFVTAKQRFACLAVAGGIFQVMVEGALRVGSAAGIYGTGLPASSAESTRANKAACG